MENRFHFRTLAIAATTALVGVTLTACSEESQEASDIVATTGVWADVASAVTGEDVEAIITGDAVDPHHFEPSAKDLARIKQAETVVANGSGYDAALYTAAEQDRIIHAIPLLDNDDHDHHDHTIEHAWFAPEKVRQVADEVAERVGGDAGVVDKRISAIEDQLNAAQLNVAMTEPIAAGLVGAKLNDVTPEEYAHASVNHQEPSASAVAKFLEQIETGQLDLLFVNPQSMNSATERLADAAKAHNVPVIEIRETPPAGVDFLDYFEQVVDQIAEISK
ncbi:metal ABC transporter solute-binding protein, Zn/Mn family [Corynebacterium lujinxingii]|uniref:Zinc ABC transporter substrate-binding protein n=1 Tax=Corynebacterium lujinxingii TaxID=2763010 RepID=A0A7H0JXZ9_9CORY|nr:zinc ABC transporter substrate-binding protein [Corynebacterium lujinxingii]MBC3178392.1 zinc ABC transporter substrate-binding protein [Corynebacterium lujinxingii]NNO10730.1 ABC transporter substrate-binding protein [Corynebacterium lujinxingii]QNP89915.1 zinc ABC transporter substrate-binding protein [Corynebacterium lujinxingii]